MMASRLSPDTDDGGMDVEDDHADVPVREVLLMPEIRVDRHQNRNSLLHGCLEEFGVTVVRPSEM
jgi:hypothetical protein